MSWANIIRNYNGQNKIDETLDKINAQFRKKIGMRLQIPLFSDSLRGQGSKMW